MKKIEMKEQRGGLVLKRKTKLNVNKDGSVRKVNGKVWIDFIYLQQRVRHSTGLVWTETNVKTVRQQLDRIMMAIADGSFVFAEVLPTHKKVDFFAELERKYLNRQLRPDNLYICSHADFWYQILKSSGRVTERTLLGYKSHLDNYIKPFFEGMNFEQLNPAVLEEYAIWARKQEYRNKPASNATINKTLIPLKMICKDAAVKYSWGSGYNPFFGFNNLPEEGSQRKIDPFSLEEQQNIVKCVPIHWKPYFQFAFLTGLRQGEQFALRVTDINWKKKVVSISKAMTRDEKGKRVEGATKNKYSQREIPISKAVKRVLLEQISLCEGLQSEYLFCTTTGQQINHANLCNRTWVPALKKAGIRYRAMIQTRHSFATTALSLGENPLWIAHVMGHRDTEMVIRVYAKFVKNAVGKQDGNLVSDAYQKMISNG